MLAEKQSKGILLYQATKTTRKQCTNIQVDVSVENEALLKVKAALNPLFDSALEADIVMKYQNIGEGNETTEPVDPEPTPTPTPEPEPSGDYQEFKVPTLQGEISNVVMTDEEAYGPEYDGENRTYILYWVNVADQKEYEVPLSGINEETVSANNPNGWYQYDSETQAIIFQRYVVEEQIYRLRKVK